MSVSAFTVRPASPDDAGLVADVMTAAYPREPEDPVIKAHRWRHPKHGWEHGRFIAEIRGRPAAYLTWQHGPWSQLPERHCWIEVWLDRAHMDQELLTEMWRWLEQAAAEQGAWTLTAACGEDEPEMMRSLDGLGYEHERTDRVWSLDLRKHGSRINAEAAAARDRMNAGGVTLTSLADWKDADRYRKLHEANELMRKDVPHTSPVLPQSIDDFMDRVGSPNTPPERWWIALEGDTQVAHSYLSFPPIRGVVWTGFTGCLPRYRGRGIATAVKLQTLAQAIELGVPEVRTANDSENKPMLHINESLGYELIPGFVSYLKRLPGAGLR